MSEYFFDVSHQEPNRRAAKKMEQIAKRYGACLVEAILPGTGYQRWFAGPNFGSPFDRRMSEGVITDLVKAGILIETTEGTVLAPAHVAKAKR